ncbi:MAG: hypothetical protein FD165_2193 [Gammaproteobacteria bacterium]|nr:MAG: hypothetical protein FD165_2193 [Gammaproteobacteria bacterium]TND03283.1 MAG: hypothetical protein FD120_1956 [Gammaproteobacteria bacterium]
MLKVIVLLLAVGVIGFALLVELTQPPAEQLSALVPATVPVVSAAKEATATDLPVLVDDERWSAARRWNERVLAEFWADGPSSETPPGHWNTLANCVSDHPLVESIGGRGPISAIR